MTNHYFRCNSCLQRFENPSQLNEHLITCTANYNKVPPKRMKIRPAQNPRIFKCERLDCGMRLVMFLRWFYHCISTRTVYRHALYIVMSWQILCTVYRHALYIDMRSQLSFDSWDCMSWKGVCLLITSTTIPIIQDVPNIKYCPWRWGL